MRSAIVAALVLVSGWANALTLSPMHQDHIVYRGYTKAYFELENTANNVMFYDAWVYKKGHEEEKLFEDEVVVGPLMKRPVSVSIPYIDPDKTETYYVCYQEKPQEGKTWGVVGRVCAKLRYYWPRSELLKLR